MHAAVHAPHTPAAAAGHSTPAAHVIPAPTQAAEQPPLAPKVIGAHAAGGATPVLMRRGSVTEGAAKCFELMLFELFSGLFVIRDSLFVYCLCVRRHADCLSSEQAPHTAQLTAARAAREKAVLNPVICFLSVFFLLFV